MLKSIWKHSTRKERWIFYLLLFLMFIAANMELLGIGLLLPVVAVLTNPELLHQNYFLELIYRVLRPESPRSFLIVLCFLITGVFLVKNLFLIFMTWFQTAMIYRKSTRMTDQLFRTYIFAPYARFLNWNTSDLLNRLHALRDNYNIFLLSLLMLLTELLNVIMIFAMFFFFVPLVTLILLAISLLISLLIYFPLRTANNRLGQDNFTAGEEQYRNELQTLNGIKEIRIHGSEDVFARRNLDILRRMNVIRCRINLNAQLPRFLLEVAMVCSAMLLLFLYLMFNTASTSIILKLSLIGAGIVRLMPALSRIQYHFTNMRHLLFSLDSVCGDMDSIPAEEDPGHDNAPAITLEREISVEHLTFSYEGTSRPVLHDFSLTVPVNSSVAFIGRTGCGKTTLADLIAGLLTPDSGRILADGRNIHENLRSWRSLIGYVPQDIYIMDDTILNNVALGIPPEQVSEEKVAEAIRMAQLDDFIRTLPDGLRTVVGEQGARLSGGQRQRIGIARALYHHPRILILDEATSALDNETEKAFIDAIRTLQGKLTMFIIAHRLTTTRDCDKIIDVAVQTERNNLKDK